MKRAGRDVCKCTVGLRRERGITSSETHKNTGGGDRPTERSEVI